jgi:uncharacterized protein YndB with AHSA1/START domain
MDETDAILETVDGRPVLRFERLLAHPPEKVWKAVTDPAELAHWFPARVETELRVGAPIRFTFDHVDLDAPDGEILTVDPPRLLVYRWGKDELRWEIVPTDSGCRLLFTQVLGGDDLWVGRLATARQAAGWDICLDQLGARLDGRPASTADTWFARNERYVEKFGLAEGDVRERSDGWLVCFERDLAQPVEQVWAALTGGPREIVVGDHPPAPATVDGVPAGLVTVVDTVRVLAYPWLRDAEPVGEVRWELVGQAFGSRLVLTQTVPADLPELRPLSLARWQVHLERFVAALHGERREWPAARVAALQRRYAGRSESVPADGIAGVVPAGGGGGADVR